MSALRRRDEVEVQLRLLHCRPPEETGEDFKVKATADFKKIMLRLNCLETLIGEDGLNLPVPIILRKLLEIYKECR